MSAQAIDSVVAPFWFHHTYPLEAVRQTYYALMRDMGLDPKTIQDNQDILETQIDRVCGQTARHRWFIDTVTLESRVLESPDKQATLMIVYRFDMGLVGQAECQTVEVWFPISKFYTHQLAALATRLAELFCTRYGLDEAGPKDWVWGYRLTRNAHPVADRLANLCRDLLSLMCVGGRIHLTENEIQIKDNYHAFPLSYWQIMS